MRPRGSGRLGRALIVVGLVLGLGLAVSTSVSAQQAVTRRIALVITNDAAGPDVASGGATMSRTLAGLGFEVLSVLNGGQRDLDRATGQIEGKVDSSTIVTIYYAGFGVRSNGRDYLLPAGAAPQSAADLANTALDLGATIQSLRDKGAKVVVILDACRRAPVFYALGGICAGDPAERRSDVYLVSAGMALASGDLTARLDPLLKDGRPVADIFDSVQAQFGASSVIQTPTRTPDWAANQRLGGTALAAAPPPSIPAAPSPQRPAPAPVQLASPPPAAVSTPPAEPPVRYEFTPTPAPPPPSADTSAAERSQLRGTLQRAVDLVGEGDVVGARRLVAGFRDRYDLVMAGQNPQADHLNYGQLAFVQGQYDVAAKEFAQARAGGDLGPSQVVLELLEGTANLRLGRLQDAVVMLERARAGYQELLKNDDGTNKYIEKLSRIRVRLGEAYRRSGRNAEARIELESAQRDFPLADNAGASMQLALLAISERDWNTAVVRANRTIEHRSSTPSQAGLAEAYVAVGRAKFALERQNEAQAWKYIDLARQADPGSQDAADFEASLPQRFLAPDFPAIRPRPFAFDYDVEGRARKCYETTDERDAYLTGDIVGETTKIEAYIGRINDYMNKLSALDAEYQSKGYDFHERIIAEHKAWDARSIAAAGRSQALRGAWYQIAAAAPVCRGEPSGPLSKPPGYQPGTAGGGLSAALPADPPPQRVMAQAAPPPALVVPRPTPAPVQSPPVVTRPPVTTAPPPKPVEPSPIVARPETVQVQASPPPAAPVVKPPPPPAPTVTAQVQTSPPPAAQPAAVSSPPPSRPTPRPQAATVTPPAPSPVKPPAPVPAPVQTEAAKPPPPQASAPQPTPAPSALAATPPQQRTATLVAPPPALVVAPPSSSPPPPAPTTGPTAKPGKGAPVKPVAGTATARAAMERGATLLGQGKYDLAQREYATAAAADPSNPEAQAGVQAARGLLRLQTGDVTSAIEDLTASSKLAPIPEALEALGRVYAVNGNRGAAIDYFGQAIKIRPNYAQAYFGRAEALRERATSLHDTAELQRAVDDYRMALTIGGQLPDALAGLGMARFALGDYQGAGENFDAALKSRPIFPLATYARARARYELGQYQDAIKDLNDLSDAFDPYAKSCSLGLAFYALGDASRLVKDEPRAIDLYRQSERAYRAALIARPGDSTATLGADYAKQKTLPNVLGWAARGANSLRRQVGAERGAVSPTATLASPEACRQPVGA